jgi:multidrug efflux pump subunit AcrA (membrane-fusion protein)
VAVLVVGGVAASDHLGRGGPRGYRTATARARTVRQQLESVAVVEPVRRASVAFPLDGTVASVGVSVGDRVTTGTRLATLDTDDLEVALHEEQASLDQARLNLALALDGQDPGALGGAGGGSGNGPLSRIARAEPPAELAAARQAVVDAQAAVDAAADGAEAAMAQAEALCATDDAAACREALAAALSAQQQVTTAQAALGQAIDDLDGLVQAWADDLSTTTSTTTPTTTPTTPTTSPSGGPTTGTMPTGGSGTAAPTGSSGASGQAATGPSAEDLVAYQRAVDAAVDEVAVAEQAIEQATVVSPIDGTVVAVGLGVGDEVTADDDASAIVVAGAGGYEVTTTVGVDDLPDVAVGQAASVVPDGATAAIAGRVVGIGVAPTASGASTYRVVVGLTGHPSGLGDGATAALTITTDTDADQLAVPTSAVTVDGTRATVRLLRPGRDQPVTTSVTVGAIGPAWTAITAGLEPGDRVVLADLDRPLPGSATDGSSSSSGTGPTFGPGGQGGPPGGFTFSGGPRGGG